MLNSGVASAASTIVPLNCANGVETQAPREASACACAPNMNAVAAVTDIISFFSFIVFSCSSSSSRVLCTTAGLRVLLTRMCSAAGSREEVRARTEKRISMNASAKPFKLLQQVTTSFADCNGTRTVISIPPQGTRDSCEFLPTGRERTC